MGLKTAYVDALEHPRSYLAFRKVKWWAAQGRWLRGGNLDVSNRYNAVRHLPFTGSTGSPSLKTPAWSWRGRS